MADSLLLAVTRVSTFAGLQALTAASGFFFERDDRLFLITARHVLADVLSDHHPDRIELALHTDAVNLKQFMMLPVPLYRDGRSLWRQATDSGGEIDVAALELDRSSLPPLAQLQAFTLRNLQRELDEVRIGSPALVVGFPLGFYDTIHHLPVARQAAVASAFGVRFQEAGYFLTDARVHRGASGAPVVMFDPQSGAELPWKLLGIHSASLDMRTREQGVDETLGLNRAWYADILKTLTQPDSPEK